MVHWAAPTNGMLGLIWSQTEGTAWLMVLGNSTLGWGRPTDSKLALG